MNVEEILVHAFLMLLPFCPWKPYCLTGSSTSELVVVVALEE
jgi:hypothetical protein